MNAVVFDWPPATRVDRLISKTEMLARAGKPAGMRERLTRELAEISWACKLATLTLNLPAAGLPEVQVFRLRLKPGIETASTPLLRAIDMAIPSPLVFEIIGESRICTMAAPKRPSVGTTGKLVLGHYISGRWLPLDCARQTLPVALDIAGLHQALLLALVPLSVRRGEGLEALLVRLAAIRAAERDCVQLEKLLDREKQFNRRVEINRKLRKTRELLATLTDREVT